MGCKYDIVHANGQASKNAMYFTIRTTNNLGANYETDVKVICDGSIPSLTIDKYNTFIT